MTKRFALVCVNIFFSVDNNIKSLLKTWTQQNNKAENNPVIQGYFCYFCVFPFDIFL